LRVLETDNWSLLLPPEWQAEQDEECVLVSDRDGVGCLEISALISDAGPFDEVRVRELCEAPQALVPGRLATYRSWTRDFQEDDAAIREWFVVSEGMLVYITYSCDLANRGLDDAAVDDILSTLRLAVDD
jgi:hypothetical protein